MDIFFVELIERRLDAAIEGADRARDPVIFVYWLTIMCQYSFFSSSLSCDGRLRGACSDCSGVQYNSAHLITALNRQKVRKSGSKMPVNGSPGRIWRGSK
jgi:hypothetical protein